MVRPVHEVKEEPKKDKESDRRRETMKASPAKVKVLNLLARIRKAVKPGDDETGSAVFA